MREADTTVVRAGWRFREKGEPWVRGNLETRAGDQGPDRKESSFPSEAQESSY